MVRRRIDVYRFIVAAGFVAVALAVSSLGAAHSPDGSRSNVAAPRPPEPAASSPAKARPPEPADDPTPAPNEQARRRPRPPEPVEPRAPEPPEERLVVVPRIPWTLSFHSRPPEPADDVSLVLVKGAPESGADLRVMQFHNRELARKVVPCTVGLFVGQAQGSGVIISPDGYVLTAGHVSAQADRNVTVILHDGQTVRGKTLGANHGIDSGLIKITERNPAGGDWPFADVARSKPLVPGDWCMATGHPGGFQRGRAPVVRIGRILSNSSGAISTDCTLVGGDSGGPLFDMEGRVIGIHSRIGGPLSQNFHVPVDTYRETWDRLATSQVWGGRLDLPRAGGPYVGVNGEGETECRITRVTENSPAAAAGIKVGDVVKSFGGKPVRSYLELGDFVARRKPGDKVKLEILRGAQALTLELTIGRRAN